MITGTTAYATFHLVDYLRYLSTLPLADSGTATFWTFLQYRAQEGLGLGNFFQNVSFRVLSGNETLTWIYWVLEFALIVGGAMFIPYAQASEPFSHKCQCWYRGEYLGSVPLADHHQLVELLQTHQFEQIRQMITADTIPPPSLDIYIERCPSCTQEPAILTIKAVSENVRGNLVTEEVFKQKVPPHQWQPLVEAETPA
jgi:hypothetical protein